LPSEESAPSRNHSGFSAGGSAYTPIIASSGCGNGDASAMSVAASTSAATRASIGVERLLRDLLAVEQHAHEAINRVVLGGPRSISPSGTYDWLSCSACPLRR
jgi:hypothetical protein